nr:hypothetical protein [uncultured Mediterranean phage uvMED]BAR15188.1 hypothetical protein [uncultured Mediterranean phage uvMED]BAR15222.1 hypothetical protein [uncultured Mediterranean phage uvMED]BAR15256.1 hypothetical protein [uncultured Mediterranean phage uvMED]BAR15270.1 hypothetical protein [uncultured Mediterranean phage uvMED]
MLEDKHCQVILKHEENEVNNLLMDFDIILRTDDKRKNYISFDIYDYKNKDYIFSYTFKKKARSK